MTLLNNTNEGMALWTSDENVIRPRVTWHRQQLCTFTVQYK